MNNKKGTPICKKRRSPVKTKKNSFSKYIKKMQKVAKEPSGVSTRELAAMVGIDYELFRKIVNMNKPTKKRDCIIAICAVLKLNKTETNRALKLYNYMPLLGARNPRDKELISILESQIWHPLSIREINERLMRNGFSELDIIDRRTSQNPISKQKNTQYILLDKQTWTYSEDLFGNQYDSLAYEYSPSRYYCIADMWLENKKNHNGYRLTTSTGNGYIIKDYSKQKSRHFSSLDAAGVFKDYFLELESDIHYEMNLMYSTLNDTKNYQMRSSAGIQNDALHVFAETFNYTVPELNEYYLFEYKNGQSVLTVYKNSEFMRCYLESNEYTTLYGKNPNTLIVQYDTIEKIREEKPSKHTSKQLLNSRIKYFKQLKQEADSLIESISKQKKYIRRLSYCFNDEDRVCEFFEVQNEFKCKLIGEYMDIMVAEIDNVDFNFTDCGTVNITLNDLYQAFELGFHNINEICRVKKKFGSLKKIIK